MPARGKAVRHRRLRVGIEEEEGSEAAREHRQVSIMPHDLEAEHLAKEVVGGLAVGDHDRLMVEAHVAEGPECRAQRSGRDAKAMRAEVGGCLADEHVWVDFMTIRRRQPHPPSECQARR